jgi:soluble P-type ATPase
MLHIEIPGQPPLTLRHLVSDLNGTLAVDGVLLSGVASRLARLSASLAVHIVTAGTHGGLELATAEVAVACAAADFTAPHWVRIASGADKARYVTDLDADGVVALGNGANDVPMFRLARLSIAVLGGEGARAQTLAAAHIVTTSPLAALDLLLHPARLVATLRS